MKPHLRSSNRLLKNKVAVVTGACGALGKAITQCFLAHGAKVVMTDLSEDRLRSITSELQDPPELSFMVADVCDESSVTQVVEGVIKRFGALNVWVNGAGFTRDATMRKMSAADFDEVIAVHLRGTWLGTRAASDWMRDQGGGAIVNIGSISGKVGNAGQTNYSAAKAGIVGLTKAAAKEVGFANIRVNVIQPGLISSAMTDALPTAIREQRISEIPLGRFGEPEEVADVALFLASDLSRYITGAVLDISGGRHL